MSTTYAPRAEPVETNQLWAQNCHCLAWEVSVPGGDSEVPVSDEGVVAAGEELEGRLEGDVQDARASPELCPKTGHHLAPGGHCEVAYEAYLDISKESNFVKDI